MGKTTNLLREDNIQMNSSKMLAAIFALIMALLKPVPEGYYPVAKVVDGDTIKVEIAQKTETIRMIGVDTPETVDPRKPVQCFGREAASKAKELMQGQAVRLEADPTQHNKDKYSRLLRYVYLKDGTLVNKKLIEEGYGFEYTYEVPYKYQLEFKAAEKAARENKRGLWADGACQK